LGRTWKLQATPRQFYSKRWPALGERAGKEMSHLH
jgi:hypothetical protein